MPAQVQTLTTPKFKDRTENFAWGAFILFTLAFIISPFLQNKLIDKQLIVSQQAPVQSDLIQYQPGLIGALRVDATAQLPANHWVTYELQILDEQGNILASGLKGAWRETGTWYEDGQSGTWDESDAKSGLALKTKDNQTQTLRVAIEVLEAGTTRNTEWDAPIRFDLKVHDGSIDVRYMWIGFVGTFVMALLTSMAAGGTGKTMISKSINDSDIGDRAVLGGSKRLIELELFIDSDETTPAKFNVDLAIRNPGGETIYQNKSLVTVKKLYDEGKIDGGTAKFQGFFLISPRASYGFYIEVTPDQSIDRTRLVVKENVKTARKSVITQIDDDAY